MNVILQKFCHSHGTLFISISISIREGNAKLSSTIAGSLIDGSFNKAFHYFIKLLNIAIAGLMAI